MKQPHPEAPFGLLPGTPIRLLPEGGSHTFTAIKLNEATSRGATLAALIRRAVSAKEMALHWQGRIKRGETAPYGEAYAHECAAFYQKQLVHLLTQIIAGDESTFAAQRGQP
jgi:hypothetical protein